MRIEALDELSGIKFAKETKEKTAIVSIVGKRQRPVRFPENANVIGTFRVALNDVDWGEEAPGRGRPPKRKDFEGMREFIDEAVSSGAEVIMIHCGSGISRAPAVASAIAKKYGLWNGYWEQRFLYPNLRAYEAACEELGVGNSEEEIRTLYETRKQISCWNATTPENWGFDEVNAARRRDAEKRRRETP